MPLPPLPQSNTHQSIALLSLYQELSQIYDTAASYLHSASLESSRLEYYQNSIVTKAYPLVILLSTSAESESLPETWIDDVSTEFTELLSLINEKHQLAGSKSVSNVVTPDHVHLLHTGKRGRPKKIVNPSILHRAFQTNLKKIPIKVLAGILGIDRKTLRSQLKDSSIETTYDTIGDYDLDKLVQLYYDENPQGGRGYVIGRLRATHGLKIQRQRVVDSMNRINPLGQGLKQRIGQKKERRNYHVPRPNALWHIDGHHKLIAWGIVIHGVADGYSRKITGLRASTSNTASTVLDMFVDAILEHGVPSRLRGDRGGENQDVSILMILLRGSHRASFMWGSSVFNTRIERMWVEVGRRFARRWKAFFVRLERCHLLDRQNTHHRWLLHCLFLEEINNDCDAFAAEWNAHPISGASGSSPNELAFLGELEHGAYVDDCENLTIEEINAFYNFNLNGEPMEDFDQEDGGDSDSSDLDTAAHSDTHSVIFQDATATDDVDRNIRHEAIPVPLANCPFNTEQLLLFEQGLILLSESGELPSGYGATPEEMGLDGFDKQESIVLGFRKTGTLMELPRSIWQPRVNKWVQGLFVMNTILSSDVA